MMFDIYHEWKGTPRTNPISGQRLVMLEAGKQIEVEIVKKLQALNFLKEVDELQERIDIVRHGAPISGKIDALIKHGGIPVEIKSFYGYHQEKELKLGNPNTGYMKQLAIYMDALGVDKGILFFVERGNGAMYEFLLVRQDDGTFSCGKIRFDIEDTYKRWGDLYENYIMKDIEPPIEHQYKVDPSKVDWTTASKTDLQKYRNGQKVYSSHPWAIQYSAYKDLIIEKQGCGLGYTPQELLEVKRYTQHLMKPTKAIKGDEPLNLLNI
jgi:hypothetical protein